MRIQAIVLCKRSAHSWADLYGSTKKMLYILVMVCVCVRGRVHECAPVWDVHKVVVVHSLLPG